jgi:hypothetical protein
VALIRVTAVHVSPTVTTGVPLKPVPVIVILVPPDIGPEPGLTDITVGAATYVNADAFDPDCPSAFVTTTVTAPAGRAGVTHVNDVELSRFTDVQDAPPNVTDGVPVNPVPVTVTPVPPVAGPLFGATAVTVGAATYVNADAFDPDCPSGFVTTTFAPPGDPAGVVQRKEVELSRASDEHAAPPTEAVGVPVNPVPVTVMIEPPVAGPLAGVTSVTVGAGLR